MAAQFRQANHTDAPSGSNPYTLQFQSLQQAGSCNVVLVAWNDTTRTVTGVTDSHSQTYTSQTVASYTSHGRQQVWYFPNIAADASTPNTVSVTFSATPTTPVSITIAEYNGVIATSPVDLFESKAGTHATNPTFTTTGTTAAATSSTPDLVIGLLSQTGTAVVATLGSSCTVRTPSGGAYTGNSYIEDKNVTNNATQTVSFTQASEYYLLSLLALKTTASLALTGLFVAASLATASLKPTLRPSLISTSVSSSVVHANLLKVDQSFSSASVTARNNLGVNLCVSSSLAAITPKRVYKQISTSATSNSSASTVCGIRILKSLTSQGIASFAPRINFSIHSTANSSYSPVNLKTRIPISVTSSSLATFGSSSLELHLNSTSNSSGSLHAGSLIYRPNLVSISSSLSVFKEKFKTQLIGSSQSLSSISPDYFLRKTISSVSVSSSFFHGTETYESFSGGISVFNFTQVAGASNISPGLISLSYGSSTVSPGRSIIAHLTSASSGSSLLHGFKYQAIQSNSIASINLELLIAGEIRLNLISNSASIASAAFGFPNVLRCTCNDLSNSNALFKIRSLSYGPIPEGSTSAAGVAIRLNYIHTPVTYASLSGAVITVRRFDRITTAVSNSPSSATARPTIRPNISHINSAGAVSVLNKLLFRSRPVALSNSSSVFTVRYASIEEHFSASSTSNSSLAGIHQSCQPLYSKSSASSSSASVEFTEIYKGSLSAGATSTFGASISYINRPGLIASSIGSSIITAEGPAQTEFFLAGTSNSLSGISPRLVYASTKNSLSVGNAIFNYEKILRINRNFTSLSSIFFNIEPIRPPSPVSDSESQSSVSLKFLTRPKLTCSSNSSFLVHNTGYCELRVIAQSSSLSSRITSRAVQDVKLPATSLSSDVFNARYSDSVLRMSFNSSSLGSAAATSRNSVRIQSFISESQGDVIVNYEENLISRALITSLGSSSIVISPILNVTGFTSGSSSESVVISRTYGRYNCLGESISSSGITPKYILSIKSFTPKSSSITINNVHRIFNVLLTSVSNSSASNSINLLKYVAFSSESNSSCSESDKRILEIKSFNSKSSGSAILFSKRTTRSAIAESNSGVNIGSFWLINPSNAISVSQTSNSYSETTISFNIVPVIGIQLICAELSSASISVSLKPRKLIHRVKETRIRKAHAVIIH